jgi:CMP-N-acetylneuraminic acid synthetase
MSIKALIHVRDGSERVDNKNMRPFAGSNLLAIKIKMLQPLVHSGCLDCVVVNSENDEMLQFAASLGCETVKRDAYFARSESTANETWSEYARTFPADIVVCTPVTSPLIDSGTIRGCISGYFASTADGKDSVNTVVGVRKYLWLDGKPINYDTSKHTRSQELPDVVALTFGCSVISRELMQARGNVVGLNPLFVKLHDVEALDVDTMFDFSIAEVLYKEQTARTTGGAYR